MTPLDTVLDRLDGLRKSNGSYQARCPAHPDTNPSLSIDERNGKVLLHCHAGCETDAILTALNLEISDLFTDTGNTGGHEVARYRYTDEDGHALFDQVRMFPKDFRLRPPGQVSGGIRGVRRVLYRLPEVLTGIQDGRWIVVVEGEKDADALTELGLVATTAPMGAGKWHLCDTQALTGAKVAVIPDNDSTGISHARDIQQDLEDRVSELRFVKLPVDTKGDAYDWIAQGGTASQLNQLIVASPTQLPESEPEKAPEPADTPLGRLEESRVSFDGFFTQERPEAEWLLEPLLPKGRSIAIIAAAKAGKSLLTLEMAAALATGKQVYGRPEGEAVNVVYVDAEMGDADLFERLESLGYGPGDEQNLAEHLAYYQLPSLPPLDTEAGGQTLLQAVETNNAEALFIDTVSRVVDGEENSNDTWQNLYRHTLRGLKAAGVTIVRLDHLGKDDKAGARGGSAKRDDIDVQWKLTAEPPRVTLRTDGVSRIAWIPERVEFQRIEGPVLEHRWSTQHVVSQQEIDLARLLDRLEVPVSYGRDRAKKAVKEALDNDTLSPEEQDLARSRNGVYTRAVKIRKDAANRLTLKGLVEAGTGRGQVSETPRGQVTGQVPETAQPSLGTGTGTGRDSLTGDLSPLVPPYKGDKGQPNPLEIGATQ